MADRQHMVEDAFCLETADDSRLCCTFSDSRAMEETCPSEGLLRKPTDVCLLLYGRKRFTENATEPDSSDVEVLTNLVQGNTPTFDLKVDAAQPPQQTANEDTTSSSLSPKIPKSTLSAPIIFEDLWGNDVGEPTVTETPSANEQIVYTMEEPGIDWVVDKELLVEISDNEVLIRPTETNDIASSYVELPLIEFENAPDLLTEFEQVISSPVFDNELEQNFLLDDIELLDIDAALAELDEEKASRAEAEKQAAGIIIGQGNVAGWMGSYGLFYINWEYGEEAEQEALNRLGFAELEISEATRAFVIQAARAARLPRRQERELTTKLDYTRKLLIRLPKSNDPENDPHASERTALRAEIADLERTLVYKMQWVAVKKATQFVGKGIDLDDLIQFGMLGVISGVKHYDVDRNARLLVVVNWWVFQSLNRVVSEYVRLVRVPIYIAETLANIKKQDTALQMSLGRLPTLKELADVIQVPVERLKQLLHLNEKPISIEWCKHAENAHEGYSFQSLQYTSVVNEDTFDDEMDKFDIKQDIEAMLQLLRVRERQVVALRYGLYDGDERTLEEVGKILHVTRERVRQIEAKAFRKIRRDYSQHGFLLRRVPD